MTGLPDDASTRPLRVLAIDGGGIRGVIPATLLAEIERRTGRRIADMFDLIGGTSTGGILALGLTTPDPANPQAPRYRAADLVNLYAEKGHLIFRRSIWHTLITLFGLLGNKYGVRGLEETLRDYFGDSRLKGAVSEVLITSYDLESRDSWFLARHKARASADSDFPMVDVARATSAAPTYFRAERLPGQRTAMVDGGVFANNPSVCCLVEGWKVFGQRDTLVVSLGTGQVKKPIPYARARAWGLIGWARPLIDVIFDGQSDTADHQLSWLLPASRYFRFQAELPPGMGAMDNTSSDHIAALKAQAEAIIAANSEQLDALCALLADTQPTPEPVGVGVTVGGAAAEAEATEAAPSGTVVSEEAPREREPSDAGPSGSAEEGTADEAPAAAPRPAPAPPPPASMRPSRLFRRASRRHRSTRYRGGYGAEPPTAEPPTAEPPTAEPPTAEPPTAEPPSTAEPPVFEEMAEAPEPMAEPPTAEPPEIGELYGEPLGGEPDLAWHDWVGGPESAERDAGTASAPVDLPGRYVNVAFSDGQRQLVASSEPLRPKQSYFVRLDIGPLSKASIVANPTDVDPALQQFEPDIKEGYWLDAVLSSSDVDLEPTIGRFFLPVEAASWVCRCVGPEHTCSAAQREQYLYLPFQTRAARRSADLRCTIYHLNNALQSLRLRVQVTAGKTRKVAQSAEVDYALSPSLSDLDAFPDRQLNVVTNESVGGTHTIVVKGVDRAVQVSLNETAAKQVLDAFRSELQLITVGSNGSPFAADNSKSTDAFVHDLRQLAHLGSQFWGLVVPNVGDALFLNAKLKTRSSIQIARVASVVFPWALVYDMPHTINNQWTLCPLLANWESERQTLSDYPTECPYASEHQPLDTLCPYGFWGFRHMIEQPPSVGVAGASGSLVSKIPVGATSRAALVRSLALDAQLSATHISALEQCLHGRFVVDDCDSVKDLFAAIVDPSLPLIYFYCHGVDGSLSDTSLPLPFVQIGVDEKFAPNDLRSLAVAGTWNPDNWLTVPPLIFINGCHTTALSPEDVADFVTALAGLNAAGVVGTEISVLQPVASEVGLNFYRYFTAAERATVGEALYKTRIDLLMKGNVAGLVYTPFCSMDLALDIAS